MRLAVLTVVVALLTLVSTAQALVAQPMPAPTTFDQAAYIICREASTVPPEQRKQLAIMLAGHSARHRGVMIPDDQRGGQLALLVRGGRTLAPDAYLFTVIDCTILSELPRLPKRR